MKTTIKILILSCALVCSFTIKAQTIRKRFTADIHAGLNFTKMDNVDNDHTKLKLGMHMGVNLNYKILGNIQIQSGFYISKKGLKTYQSTMTEPSAGGEWTKTEVWYNATGTYIQIPLNLGYEVFVGKKTAFNINAGVYGAYGYKGKGNTKAVDTSGKGNEIATSTLTDETAFESFDPLRWKRLDYGLNASIGFIYDIYTINVNYEHGLHNILNMSNAAYRGLSLKNRLYSVSLGFRF